MARRYGDKVTIIGMAGRDRKAEFDGFVAEHKVGFLTHTADEDGELWNQLEVVGQPTWFFIDGDGSVNKQFGALGAKGLTEAIEQHLDPA